MTHNATLLLCFLTHQLRAEQAAAQRVAKQDAHNQARAAELQEQAGQLRGAQQAWDARLAEEQAAAAQVLLPAGMYHQSWPVLGGQSTGSRELVRPRLLHTWQRSKQQSRRC